ncbi:MAG: hypothetical protein ACTSR3_06945 [Candidatus Helarchaeota archaeon]
MNANEKCYICDQNASINCIKCLKPICENHCFNNPVFSYQKRNIFVGTEAYCSQCNKIEKIKDKNRFLIVISILLSIIITVVIFAVFFA